MKKIKVMILWSIPVGLLIFSVFNYKQKLNENRDYIKSYLRPYEISVTQSLNIDNLYIPNLSLINLKIDERINIFEAPKQGDYLIALFSEHSCNPCSKLLLRFCNELYKKGFSNIYGILNLDNLNETKRFILNNNINYTPLFDPGNEFMKKLNISESPALLLVDKNNKIISSLFLQPELENITELFFNHIRSQVNKKLIN